MYKKCFIILFFLAAAFVFSGCRRTENLTFDAKFLRIAHEPAPLIQFLRNGILDSDMEKAALRLPEELHAAGIDVFETVPASEIRLGGKMVTVGEYVFWNRFETPGGNIWIDILGFANEDAAKALMNKRNQWHSGTTSPDHFNFFTLQNDSGLNAAAVIIRRGACFFNFGVHIPFKIYFPGEESNTQAELKVIEGSINTLLDAMAATARALKDPNAITWVPPASPDSDEIRRMRVASFARFWSEVKNNFVFIDQRPELDWDRVFELYLPRVESARSRDEFIRVLEECAALLRDGHTWVRGSRSFDRPLLRIEPVEGRPVVTALGTSAEIQQSGIKPGMELIEVSGVSVDLRLKNDLYPVIFASTIQDRDTKAFARLLEGETDSTITAVFQDMDGALVYAEIVCRLNRNRDEAPWTRIKPFEFRKLKDGIAYIAVNTFGTNMVVAEFDKVFDKIIGSKGLIIDIRENGGGNTNHGFDIIARLIENPCDKTSKWRTREYRPTFRAWNREEGWYYGDHGIIEPRGEKPFTGPVAVLVGPKTFSAAEDFLVPLKSSGRAVIIGEPTGGSTGQPLRIELYETSAGICTKWDYFPDGTEFTGIGIIPDINVQRTKSDIAEGRDTVLAKAEEFLNK